jgi:hypothetical protein
MMRELAWKSCRRVSMDRRPASLMACSPRKTVRLAQDLYIAIMIGVARFPRVCQCGRVL